mgnify:CR=1 FL=1|jgi:hypothetical protein
MNKLKEILKWALGIVFSVTVTLLARCHLEFGIEPASFDTNIYLTSVRFQVLIIIFLTSGILRFGILGEDIKKSLCSSGSVILSMLIAIIVWKRISPGYDAEMLKFKILNPIASLIYTALLFVVIKLLGNRKESRWGYITFLVVAVSSSLYLIAANYPN